MMNLGAGLGLGAEARARDLSLAPAGARPAVEHSPSAAGGVRTRQASHARGSRRFEDELEDSLSSRRDDRDDPIDPVVIDQGPQPSRDVRPRNCAAERSDVSLRNEQPAAVNAEDERAQATSSESAEVASESPAPPTSAAAADDQSVATVLPVAIPVVNATVIAVAEKDQAAGSGEDSASRSTDSASAAVNDSGPDAAKSSVQKTAEAPAAREWDVREGTAPKVDIGRSAPAERAVPAPAPQRADVLASPEIAQVAPETPAESKTALPEAIVDAAPDRASAMAAESPFEATTEDGSGEPSGQEPSVHTQPATAERQATETFKAPSPAGGDLQAARESHVSGPVTGLGAAPLSRLQEFEAARAGLSSASYVEVPEPDTPDRIVQSLRMQYQRGGGEAVVQIRPQHLGPLTISLRVEHGTVTAHVLAENPVTAEWLQANEQTLREGLKSSGLQLDRLVINRDPDPSGRSPQREESQARRDQRRRFNERQSTFEINV